MKTWGMSVILLVSVLGHSQTYTESILYNFTGYTDGAYPVGGLVRDSAGNLYGTAQTGGNSGCNYGGCGTVFKLDPNGNETTLHIFAGGKDGTDGSYPNASLAIDKAGNLYGTTMFGGLGYGTVFKITAAGAYSILHQFNGTGDGYAPQGPVTLDAAGNLYGTTSDWSTCSTICEAADLGCGVVYKLNSKGAETILHTFAGPDGCTSIGNVIRDGVGNLYAGTTGGGSSGYGALIKLTSTKVESVLYNFCSLANCMDGTMPMYIVRSSAGNFYASVSSVNGNGYGGGIVKVTPQGVGTVLSDLCCGTTLGSVGSLLLSSGIIYGTANQSVFSLSTAGVFKTLYSFGNAPDGTMPLGGVIKDSAGNLYGTTAAGGLYGQRTVFKLTKQ